MDAVRRTNSFAGLPAADPHRVCRAWHRASRVEVPIPGVSGAEGKEKDKGVTARWGLEEVQSEHAGRRTGTGYEVWYTRDELARDNEVLHPHGVCFINPASTHGRFCVLPREISHVPWDVACD